MVHRFELIIVQKTTPSPSKDKEEENIAKEDKKCFKGKDPATSL